MARAIGNRRELMSALGTEEAGEEERKDEEREKGGG